jgi:hypothetical protein
MLAILLLARGAKALLLFVFSSLSLFPLEVPLYTCSIENIRPFWLSIEISF